MLKTEAKDMLRRAFGPGDAGEKVEELWDQRDELTTIELGDELIDWLAERLSDEEG